MVQLPDNLERKRAVSVAASVVSTKSCAPVSATFPAARSLSSGDDCVVRSGAASRGGEGGGEEGRGDHAGRVAPLTRRFAPPSPRKRGEGSTPQVLLPARGEKVARSAG